MKCINFENHYSNRLSEEEKQHLEECPRCRLNWQIQLATLALKDEPLEFAGEPENDYADIPPGRELISDEFRKKLEAYFDGHAAWVERFKDNPKLLRKLREIAGKVSTKILPEAGNFDDRFATALGYLSDDETMNLEQDELLQKIQEIMVNMGDNQ